jgi:hypothetical protein
MKTACCRPSVVPVLYMAMPTNRLFSACRVKTTCAASLGALIVQRDKLAENNNDGRHDGHAEQGLGG